MGTKKEADEEEDGRIDISWMFDGSRSFYTRHEIDTSREQRILTGLIISDEACKRAMPMIDPHYFEMDSSRVVFPWIKGC